MHLDRQPVTLGSGPRCAQRARRWAIQTCLDLGREELIECAELAVSEVVTNAILHGTPPVTIRIGGTPDHPRFEIEDCSALPPSYREGRFTGVEDSLSTLGRGLSLVALASDAWGAVYDPHGKTIWFVPATEFKDQETSPSGLEMEVHLTPPPGTREHVVRLLGLDPELSLRVVNQYFELRRELQLLALAHEQDYPLARSLSDMYTRFESYVPVEANIEAMRASGSDRRALELRVWMGETPPELFTTMGQMLDLADGFCAEHRLLSMARTARERRFHEWLLNEIVSQVAGQPPQPWSTVDPG